MRGDWDAGCDATALTATDDAGMWSADLDVPAGDYEYRVVRHGDGDPEFGLDGGEESVPLSIAGSSTLRFTFDDTAERIAVEPVSPWAAAIPKPTTALVAEPIREAGGDERFYFVMTDRSPERGSDE